MDTAMIEKFVDLETGVWEALLNGDGQADAALLSADFLGVYETGFSNRTEHAAMLGNGPIVLNYQIEDARLRVVTDKAVLLSYLACYTKPADPASPSATTQPSRGAAVARAVHRSADLRHIDR